MFVCRSIIGIGARTAGPAGTGEAPFDAPEQPKDYGDNFRVTSASDTCDIANPCKKYLAQAADQTNGRIQSKLGVPIATTAGHVPFG